MYQMLLSLHPVFLLPTPEFTPCVVLDRLQFAGSSAGHVSLLFCLRVLVFWGLLCCSTGKLDRVGDLAPLVKNSTTKEWGSVDECLIFLS